MEKIELLLNYEVYEWGELSLEEQLLLSKALEATHHAYAPYSHFYVGAAVQLSDGSIILGNNQENAAYPSGICAERNALFHVGALGKGKEIISIAIRARTDSLILNQPIFPCGACRQVMLEYEQMCQRPIKVLMQGETGKVLIAKGIENFLLPLVFRLIQ
ncbi:MAG: cytidine deaminase [Bacteroidia bacterium]|nr:MAG: cytidine deaminase [Bacteroidia bacterium]